jgi:microcystin-dependent protein
MTPYIGEIRDFGFSFAPVGWVKCDGRLLSIAQETTLYTLIGTTYGGDGVNTFGVPDLRGRVPIGMGQGPGLSNYVQGQLSGTENTTLGVNNLPSHTHALNAKAGVGNQGSPTNHLLAASDQRNRQYTSAAADTTSAANTIGSAGSGLPFNNVQPFLATNYCISTQGVFPSRN